MAIDGFEAIQSPMSRLLRIIVSASVILLALSAPPALASNNPGGGDPGVTAGPHSYNPYAKSPGSDGTISPGKSAPAISSGGTNVGSNGCTIQGTMLLCPKCADPAGTGICNGPAAAPTITPAQLAQQSWNSLQLPVPDVQTAPPRGSRGLVGLAEWVWVPSSQWHPMVKRASAGGVWAQVTATPKQLRIEPGAGLPAVTCAGPGTAYDPSRAASVQQSDCSYTYSQSSATQPGAAYRVRVTVVWGGTWTGSGGAGGTLPDISRSTTFGLRVAEAQGLYG
jgi:hypothetical protein